MKAVTDNGPDPTYLPTAFVLSSVAKQSEALPFSFRARPLSASIVEETTLYGPWILDGMEINTVV